MSSSPVQTPIGAAFSAPVLGAQRCFRQILSALSGPGTVQRLTETIEAPAGFAPAAMQCLLTLADGEAPVWLAPSLADRGGAFIRFHCGAPIVEAPAEASFAVLDGADRTPGLAAFNIGDDRYPDRSATVIVQCQDFSGGPTIQLSGPGIRGTCSIAPAGLHPQFWAEVAANHELYPLGVDLILAAGEGIIGIPRSTAIIPIAGDC